MIKHRTECYEETACGDVVPPYDRELPPEAEVRAEIDPNVEEAILEAEELRRQLAEYGANPTEIKRKIARHIAHQAVRLARDHDISRLLALLPSETASDDAEWTPSSNHPEPNEPRERDWMERAAGDN